MKGFRSWNRRDFIAKPIAGFAAAHLLGGVRYLFGETQPAAQPGAAAKPIYRTLGRTGISLPIISMGVMNADVPGLIPRSYEIGVRHFDTAAHYQNGRNEEMVGGQIKQLGVRDKVTISTKVLRPSFGPPGESQAKVYTTAEIKAHFDETFAGCLKRLQTDYVDILYNHSCDSEEDIASEGALKSLTEQKKAGHARWIGVSSHQPEMALKLAMKLGVYDVVLIQFNHSMADDESLMKTIDEAAKSGIGIVAMKTLRGGFQRSDSNRPGPGSSPGRPSQSAQAPPSAQASQGPPQMPSVTGSPTALLKWVLRHESITTAIPGYTTYDQMEQNFSVAYNLDYTPAEQEFISNKKNVAEAQFCRQCGQCVADCPNGVKIPLLMRTHMYALQYKDHWLARDTMASIAAGKGLDACANCDHCQAQCRHQVDIAHKIQRLKEIYPALEVNA